MKSMVYALLDRKIQSVEQFEQLFTELLEASPIQQTAVLTLLAAQGVSFEALMGAQRSLFKQAICMSYPEEVVDVVGTGGDGKGTFNISTAASLVVASCGVPVAKHGGRSVTSQSGSSDVMAALEIPCARTSLDVIKELDQFGYVFLSAPYFNQALNQVSAVRSQLGFPTIFNGLGPLLNPLQPKRQVVGVYQKALLPIVARVLMELGSHHALVVHAEEGLDELSVSGRTWVMEVRDQHIIEYCVEPAELGFSSSTLSEMVGGSPHENAHIIRAIFSGEETGAPRDAVLLNAAAGLFVAGKVSLLRDGIMMAADAIDTGKTQALLSALKQGVVE